jgi:hypothetical protein
LHAVEKLQHIGSGDDGRRPGLERLECDRVLEEHGEVVVYVEIGVTEMSYCDVGCFASNGQSGKRQG